MIQLGQVYVGDEKNSLTRDLLRALKKSSRKFVGLRDNTSTREIRSSDPASNVKKKKTL